MGKKKLKEWIWWKHGIIYHIYPLSFYDSNSDGKGDLKGIIAKLDYLVDLGINAIWLSPVYKSPMVDFGYDISDYRQIDPIFGDIEIFKEFLTEAHIRGIYVIMDLVLNHTSDQHSWFIESRSSKDNPKRDWYIWQKGENGKKPNNWKSTFGGSAWQYDEKTGEYYLHSFLPEQPDLNWRNKKVKNALFSDIKFWLKLGVDGFRLDVINNIVKDKKLRNLPNIWDSFFGEAEKPLTRNHPKSYKIVQKFRKLLDKYENKMSVGEIYALPPGDSELAASYVSEGDDSIHMAFDFSLIFRFWSAKGYYKCLESWYNSLPEKGWPCNVLSNHDLYRSFNRYPFRIHKLEKAKIAAVLLLTTLGTPFIYYGEEIGMRNGSVRKSEIKDPVGKRFWPFIQGRDKCRTPMQWNSDVNSGFSLRKPWLPINKDYKIVNVEKQLKDDGSLLNLYKAVIKLRKKYPSLYKGDWQPIIKGENGILAYSRTHKKTIFVILNFTSKKKRVKLDNNKNYEILFSTCKNNTLQISLSNFELSAYEAIILQESIN